MIRKITAETLGKNKAGWTYDRKSDVWYTWEVDTIKNHRRIRQRGFRTQKLAEEFLNELKLKEKLKNFGIATATNFPTVKEVLDRHYQTITHPKQVVSNRRIFDNFLKLLPEGFRVDELRKAHFKAFADWRLSQPRKDGATHLKHVAPNTVRKELGFIYAAIGKAEDYFPQMENWQRPKTYFPDVDNTPTGQVVEDQDWRVLVDELLKAQSAGESERDFRARRRTGLVFYFALLTGLRHGEIAQVRKDNYDESKRRLTVERTKTKKKGIPVTVFEPLTDAHIRVLNEAAELYPDGVYFFSKSGVIDTKNYQILKKKCAELGLKYGRYDGFVVHSARHTFATALDHSGIDRTTSRSLTAHTKDVMFDRYSHASTASKSNALNLISEKFALGAAKNKSLPLREIYDKVKDGTLSFAEFEAEIGKI